MEAVRALLLIGALNALLADPFTLSYRGVVQNGLVGDEQLMWAPRLTQPEGTLVPLTTFCADDKETIETFHARLPLLIRDLLIERESRLSATALYFPQGVREKLVLLVEPTPVDTNFNGDCATISLYK